MRGPKRALSAVVVTIAVAMIAAAVYSATANLSRDALSAIHGVEIVVMAVLVLPWFTVYANRAAACFGRLDAVGAAWSALAIGSVLLLLGQLAAYIPAALDLGRVEAYLAIAGQFMPAVFRLVLCWALWRVRRAYRETGIDFHLKPVDYIASVAVTAIALVLISRREILFAYWSANSDFDEAARVVMTAAQVFNFLLYAAVFASSMAMSRYAMQMGGGLVARAWGGVALYGLLQAVHAFVISVLWPLYGPIAAIAFDNFIVLAAFAALAYGPICQVEAADVTLP